MPKDPLETEKKHRNTMSVAKFIRDYLLKNKTASVYDIYAEYKQFCHDERITDKPLSKARCSYSSVRVIVYVLRKVGVIENVKKEDPMYEWTTRKKQLIRLVPGQSQHPVFDDVWKFYRGEEE